MVTMNYPLASSCLAHPLALSSMFTLAATPRSEGCLRWQVFPSLNRRGNLCLLRSRIISQRSLTNQRRGSSSSSASLSSDILHSFLHLLSSSSPCYALILACCSGWRALKSVVMWWDTTIEIQIQVLRNYHRERERITKESHSEFKARREELRDVIATAKPLFGFYRCLSAVEPECLFSTCNRDLLQWLFQTTAANIHSQGPPTFNNVRVELLD